MRFVYRKKVKYSDLIQGKMVSYSKKNKLCISKENSEYM